MVDWRHCIDDEKAGFSPEEAAFVDTLVDYVDCYTLILDFFKGDHQKTKLWFTVQNPLLGGIQPITMVIKGRSKKLLQFVKSTLEGNRP